MHGAQFLEIYPLHPNPSLGQRLLALDRVFHICTLLALLSQWILEIEIISTQNQFMLRLKSLPWVCRWTYNWLSMRHIICFTSFEPWLMGSLQHLSLPTTVTMFKSWRLLAMTQSRSQKYYMFYALAKCPMLPRRLTYGLSNVTTNPTHILKSNTSFIINFILLL
jgi:hypothetical protein